MSDEITVDPLATHTPNLNLAKPDPGGDIDIWGDLINGNFDIIDTVSTRAAILIGVMDASTGICDFTLASGDPDGLLPAATPGNQRDYVVVEVSGTPPAGPFRQALNVGDYVYSDGAEWTRVAVGGAHATGDTTFLAPPVFGETVLQMAMQAAETAVNARLPLIGGTLTGPLQVPNGTLAIPSLQIGAADGTGFNRSANTLSVSIQGTLSASFFAGSMQTYGQLYMLGNKIVQVADATAAADALNLRTGDARYLALTGSVPMAGPLDMAGNLIHNVQAPQASLDVANRAYVDATPALHNIGRSYIHNGLFNIAQRGGGPFAATGYTLDRWTCAVGGGTISVGQTAAIDFDRAGIGDEAVRWIFTCVGGGTAGAGDYIIPGTQLIEDVQRLSGKTVTLSFWARVISGSASSKLGIDLYQNFGAGGSPSANVKLGAQAVTLASTWARYTTTWNVPSIAGKTLGTTPNTSHTGVQLWMSSGASNNVDAGGIGVQSYTLGLWGVQLEVGSVATPLEKLDPRLDLANCQRFYQTGNFLLQAYNTAGSTTGYMQALSVHMHHVPTMAPFGTPTLTNCSNLQITPWNVGVFQLAVSATAAGPLSFFGGYSASADL
jgi:hypothetical protein